MTSALRRLPIESARPMVVFALVRVVMASTALVLVLRARASPTRGAWLP